MNRRKINDSLLDEMLQQGKSYKEIGAAMGVSAPAICQRLKRLKLMNPPDSFKALTQKEQHFVMGIVEGKSRTQSALESFDCSTRASAKAMQHELCETPKIQQALTEMGQRFEMIGKGRSYRAERIGEHMENSDAIVSLKAIEMASKLSDDFPATKNMNMNLDASMPLIDLTYVRYIPGVARYEEKCSLCLAEIATDNFCPACSGKYTELIDKVRRYWAGDVCAGCTDNQRSYEFCNACTKKGNNRA